MQNVRHLWSAVRPNGDHRPYNLNRLELRICDLVTNPLALLAIVALLEARLHQLFAEPELDPLNQSSLTPEELLRLSDQNEMAAAANSLEATLNHWQDGRAIAARDWIQTLYQEGLPYAKQQGFSCFLSPLLNILREGNTAQRWLAEYRGGQSLDAILQRAIQATAQEESLLAQDLCLSINQGGYPALNAA
jgi:predicted glutamate--cysteine ligase